MPEAVKAVSSAFLRARRWLLMPVLRLIVRVMKADPWERFEKRVPLKFFSERAAEFESYFQRSSAVGVKSVDDVQRWLMECTYVSDQVEFGVPEHWQHPSDFEGRRRGDCEDHALWAWRKLIEVGEDAEFVVGLSQRADGTWGGHAWVHVRGETGVRMFEAGEKSLDRMLRPLTDEEIQREYFPHLGVDSAFRRHVYWGWLIDLAEPKLRPNVPSNTKG